MVKFHPRLILYSNSRAIEWCLNHGNRSKGTKMSHDFRQVLSMSACKQHAQNHSPSGACGCRPKLDHKIEISQ